MSGPLLAQPAGQRALMLALPAAPVQGYQGRSPWLVGERRALLNSIARLEERRRALKSRVTLCKVRPTCFEYDLERLPNQQPPSKQCAGNKLDRRINRFAPRLRPPAN